MGQNAGELRHHVIIQHYVAGGRDEDGFEIEGSWQEYKKLWAKVEDYAVRDVLLAKAGQSETRARCRLRWSEGARQIDTTMRVIYEGDIYAIDGPPLRDNIGGKTYCTLMLSKGIEKTQ